MNGPSPLVTQLAGALRLLQRQWFHEGYGRPAELEQFVSALAAQSGTQQPNQLMPPEGGHPADVAILLTYAATAEALMLSERKVRAMVTAGQLPVVSIGRSKRIPREALVEWVRSKSKGAA